MICIQFLQTLLYKLPKERPDLTENEILENVHLNIQRKIVNIMEKYRDLNTSRRIHLTNCLRYIYIIPTDIVDGMLVEKTHMVEQLSLKPRG